MEAETSQIVCVLRNYLFSSYKGTEQTVVASPSSGNDKNPVIIICIDQIFPMHLKANDFNKQKLINLILCENTLLKLCYNNYSIVLDCSSIILRPRLALCCCKYLIMSACLSNNSSKSSPSLDKEKRRM